MSKLLENQLLAQEQQISSQRTQIAALEQRSGGASGAVLAGSPGSLQILDPIFVATRGRSTAVVRSPGKRKLLGRVSNPAAVASITVNGQPATLAANGTFSSDIDVAAGGTQVKVAAVDKRGGRAQLDFTMVPQAGGGAASATALAPAGAVPRDLKLGRYFAVVIGNNTYRDGSYAPLKSAASDATAVANVLRGRYGYQTTVLLNASRLEMLSALNDIARRAGSPTTTCLIYYAGHGEMDGAGQGYWNPNRPPSGNTKTWVAESNDHRNSSTSIAGQKTCVTLGRIPAYSGTNKRAALDAQDF